MTPIKATWLFSAALLVALPHSSLARTGSMTVGLATSYDYEDRQYDGFLDSEGEEVAGRTEKTEQVGLTPLITLVSEGQTDRVEIRLAPTLVYDLRDSETDWDADIALIAEKVLSQNWRVSGSNTFLRSDEHSPDFLDITEPDTPAAASTDDLTTSAELERERYWQNTLATDLFYTYGEEREAGIGLDWTVLREDDSDAVDLDDYDRYALRLTNEYRFNPFWKNTARLALIRGEYPDSSGGATIDAEDFDRDLWEYRAGIGIENNSFRLTSYLLDYDYIGARYDELDPTQVLEDVDIHSLRLTWRREISQQWSVALGGGPTYVRPDIRDDEWGGNGLAEINFRDRYTTIGLLVESGYDVDDFSGTDELGLVEYSEARLSASHQFLERLTLNGALIYRQESRDLPVTATTDTPDSIADDTTEDLYAASVGLAYSFLRYYRLGLDYTYSQLDSDLPGDDYDDHRILLSLSWEQEWMRW